MDNEDLILKEVEVSRISLQPGEVLAITVKHDEVTQEDLFALKEKFEVLFPNNQIFLMNLGTSGDLKFSVVSQSKTSYSSCSSPASYCSDCRCGKKERIEGKK